MEKWKKLLPWRDWQSMPSHSDYPDHDSLPRDLQFEDSKQRDMSHYGAEGFVNILLQGIKDIFKDIESYFDYTKFFALGVGQTKMSLLVLLYSITGRSDMAKFRLFLKGGTLIANLDVSFSKEFTPMLYVASTSFPPNFPLLTSR